jgi:hypothetical protein
MLYENSIGNDKEIVGVDYAGCVIFRKYSGETANEDRYLLNLRTSASQIKQQGLNFDKITAAFPETKSKLDKILAEHVLKQAPGGYEVVGYTLRLGQYSFKDTNFILNVTVNKEGDILRVFGVNDFGKEIVRVKYTDARYTHSALTLLKINPDTGREESSLSCIVAKKGNDFVAAKDTSEVSISPRPSPRL